MASEVEAEFRRLQERAAEMTKEASLRIAPASMHRGAYQCMADCIQGETLDEYTLECQKECGTDLQRRVQALQQATVGHQQALMQCVQSVVASRPPDAEPTLSEISPCTDTFLKNLQNSLDQTCDSFR